MYGVTEDFKAKFPLTHLKKGDVVIFICEKPYFGCSVLCVEKPTTQYLEDVPEAVWRENGPKFDSGDKAKACFVRKYQG